MSEAAKFELNESHDSGVDTEKESEISACSSTSSPKDRLSSGSMTALNANKEVLEKLPRVHRRSRSGSNHRSVATSEKRSRKRFFMFYKRNKNKVDTFPSSPVTVVEYRGLNENLLPHVIGALGNEEMDRSDDIIKLTQKEEKESASFVENELDNSFEKMKIDKEVGPIESDEQSEFNQNTTDFKYDLGLDDTTACVQKLLDNKRRSVQWKGHVDVIYYVENTRGGKVVRRKNEPLREENDQQARRHNFIQLAITKSLLANVSAAHYSNHLLTTLQK